MSRRKWKAEWVEHMQAYRIFDTADPIGTIAYIDDTEVDKTEAKERADFYGASLIIEKH